MTMTRTCSDPSRRPLSATYTDRRGPHRPESYMHLQTLTLDGGEIIKTPVTFSLGGRLQALSETFVLRVSKDNLHENL